MDALIPRGNRPLSFWLYPPYPWRGPTRRRTYAVLRTGGPGEPVRLITEHGEVVQLADDKALYPALRQHILDSGLTVYSANLKIGTRNAGLVYGAMVDAGAHVLYSPRRGLMGYTFSQGKRHGALLGMGSWGVKGWTDSRWLRAVRKLSAAIGCGDYDTAGALGQATLTRFWHTANLPYQWRLGGELESQLLRYQIGGRAEAPGLGSEFPSAIEYDLSSAYPTAVARGLPAGRIAHHNQHHEDAGTRPMFGIWRVVVTASIPISPIPYREWDRDGSPLCWSLHSDMDPFLYAGWSDEIAALRGTGCATAEFIRGWSWDRLDTMLAPWVDELTALRSECEAHGDRDVAQLVKLVANAGIGRWGMAPEQYSLVPDYEHDLSRGDVPLQIEGGLGPDDALIGAWVRLTDTESRHALPQHWASYVRMAVRMEVWRATTDILRQGYTVALTNFDAVWLASNSPTAPALPVTQFSHLPDVRADQESHPWHWRPKKRANVQVLASRSVVWEDENGIQLTMPGMSQAMRMAVLVDHQRKRAERLERERAEVPVCVNPSG